MNETHCVQCRYRQATHKYGLCATCYFDPEIHRARRTGSRPPTMSHRKDYTNKLTIQNTQASDTQASDTQ